MPTLPIKASRIPEEDAPVGEIIARALEMIANTSPFDVTGHPAMSLPCGKVDGLPAGATLVGRHDAEKTIYQAAHAYEQGVDWRTQ
jgi:amidase